MPYRQRILYVALMGGGGGVAFVRQFVYARLLGPQLFGAYALVVLVSAYAIYLCSFGLNEGLIRELSLLRSAGRDGEADALRDQSLTAMVAGMGLACLVSAAAALLVRDAALARAVLLVGPYGLFTVLVNLALIDLRARRQAMGYAGFLLLRNLAMLAAGAAPALWQSAPGVLAGEMGAQLLVVVGVLRCNGGGFRPHLAPRARLAGLVRVGFLFNLGSFFRHIAVNVDRWFVAALFPIAAFGHYAFAMTLLAGGLLIGTIVGAVLEPHLIYRFGRGEDPRRLFRFGCVVSALLGAVMLAGALPAIGGLDFIVPRYYPRYAEALPLIPLVYLGTSFYVMNVFDHVILAFGTGRNLLAMHAATAAAVGLACVALALGGAGPLAFVTVFCCGRLASLAGNLWVTRALARRMTQGAAVDFRPLVQDG